MAAFRAEAWLEADSVDPLNLEPVESTEDLEAVEDRLEPPEDADLTLLAAISKRLAREPRLRAAFLPVESTTGRAVRLTLDGRFETTETDNKTLA